MTAPDLPSFQTDLFVPVYRPMRRGAWHLRIVETVLCPGYWSPPSLVRGMAALMRGGKTWMSTTPLEIESQEIGVRHARGHVLIFGLGMGWAAAACALRPEVTAVTVVERDEDVLDMHRDLAVFAQLPDHARDKVRIEHGDAYAWTARARVDLLMPDIWLPLVSDGRVEEVRRMQANVRADAVYFWGQELEIARHAAAARRDIDPRGVSDMAEAMELPLLGPLLPDYARRVEAVARRWMRGRWLPETVPPF